MKISKEARKISKQLFLDSFVNSQLDEARVRNIARTLIDEKPRKYAEILKNYQRLIRLELAKHHAVIESAGAKPKRGASPHQAQVSKAPCSSQASSSALRAAAPPSREDAAAGTAYATAAARASSQLTGELLAKIMGTV